MASNKPFSFGPVALTTTTTTNILNGAITSLAGPVGFTATQPRILLRHIRVVNKTNAAAKFGLWLGATGANAAGTEVVAGATAAAGALTAGGVSIPAGGVFDWYDPGLPLESTQFLVGGADTATALTIQGSGEIGFS